jgi:hypothetical protein
MTSFDHFSNDIGEIVYIRDDRNVQSFKDLGVKVEHEDNNTLRFSAKSASSLEKAKDELAEIIKRYYSPTTRRINVSPDMVGYFRGPKSERLKEVKKTTGVGNVFFNDITDVNGVVMVEIVVTGSRPAINSFMTEVLRSISSLTQKNLGFVPPTREEREADRALRRSKASFKKKTKEEEDDDEDVVEPEMELPKVKKAEKWEKVEKKKKPKLPPVADDDSD